MTCGVFFWTIPSLTWVKQAPQYTQLVCERMVTSGVGLGDVPLGACSYVTFRCSLLKKQMAINEMRKSTITHTHPDIHTLYLTPVKIYVTGTPPVTMCHQDTPIYFDRYVVVLHRFTLSSCRSISKAKLAVPST